MATASRRPTRRPPFATASPTNAGNVTTFTNDSARAHRLTQVDALNQTTTMTWSRSAPTITDPLGHRQQYRLRHVATAQDVYRPAGRVATVTYDSNGNVGTTVDALGRTTTYAKRRLGPDDARTDPDAAVWPVGL